jgi:ubiquinol-cytochrome c reductase iron-sulfur subunit
MKPARVVQLSLALSAAASLALTGVYWAGGQPQVEGGLLFLSLGGLALGLIVWAKVFMPRGPFVEARTPSGSSSSDREAVAADSEAPDDVLPRRAFFGRLFAGALTALGLAAVFPIRSLGSKPGRSLFETSWSTGARLVTRDGVAVRASDLEVGGVVTVFPEGHVDVADSQTLLVRVEEGEMEIPAGREDWSPGGNVAYSKICTHAGCPVGLFDQDLNQLICPCHQSAFQVLRAAEPISGPATRALPQLPLDVDAEGYLIARSDYEEPVGPGFWNRP